jgi:hypothetical protein
MRIKTTSALCAAVLLVAAIAATCANASGLNLSGLELKEHGTPVPVGATVENELLVFNGFCKDDSAAKLLDNGALIDLLVLEAPFYTQCEPGASVAGGISSVVLGANAVALLVALPTLEVTLPSGCVYGFELLQGKFTIGPPYGGTYIQGEATGRWTGVSHGASCARTMTTEFAVALQSEGSTLETELTPLRF